MVVMQGLMPLVRSAQEVQEDMQREADNKKINMTLERNIQLTQVVGHVTNCFQLAVEAKRDIQTIMLDCAMQIKGKYSPEKLTSIKAGLPGGSEVFMNVTEEKCRATKAWVKDIIKETNKKPFMIENTPIPELPEDLELLIRQRIAAGIQTGEITLEQGLKVVEEKLREELLQAARDDAKEKAKKMELKIHDEHLQGNWHKALDEFISDVIDYPAGILKGPIFHKRRVLKWDTDKQGNAKPIVKEVIEKHWYRVSPFDFYPSPTAKNVQDSYMIEHHRLTRTKLYNMMGQAGYDSDAIDRILKKDEAGQLADWNYVIREGEQAEGIAPDNINNKAPDQKIDALEYWGDIKGSDLIEWGMSESKIKHPNKMYQANIWKIDNEIIKAILNPHPLGEKPYFICSFSKITGAFWGKGVPEIIKHIQDILNAIARAMVNNLAIASGPQVSKDIALMKSGENPTHITPWEIHLYNSAANEGLTANNNPVNFFQPTMNSRPLMALFEFFKKLTDEYTGIPAYTYGVADAGGAASTASGLSMLITAAGKVIKNIMIDIDNEVIAPAVQYHYDLLMLFDKDMSIKGDARIIASGATTLVAKEQQLLRLTEFANILNNPTDNMIIGIKGRAMLLRMIMEQFPVNVDDIIPSDEEIEQRMQQQMEAEMGSNREPKKTNQVNLAGEPPAGGDHALYTQRKSA